MEQETARPAVAGTAVATSPARPTPRHLQTFQRAALRFYRREKRELPWRSTRDPYRILVSEVMLQQTQVDRVIPKYRAFLARFPTLRSLARARFADVLRVWLGLGYNGRALRLWRCACTVVRERDGRLPRDAGELARLPGIGPYTAAAVAAIAFDARVAAVDVNVRRVISRALAGHDRLRPPAVSLLARDALPRSSAGEWAQALMDIGAQHCKARPRCAGCPLRASCAYLRARLNPTQRTRTPARSVTTRAAGAFAGSTRYYRGCVMRELSRHGSLRATALGRKVKPAFGISDAAWLRDLLAGLVRDGLIRIDRDRVALP
jgi:A/G-specific adenine glycosylase